MAAKTAAKLKEAALALLSDSGPDYDIDPSEVAALLGDIVDSAPSLGLAAMTEENREAVAALQAVTRDLHRSGETAAPAKSEDAALGALLVDNGGALDASSAPFAAQLDRVGSSWTGDRIAVRLADAESRSKWLVRLVGDGGQAFDLPGGQWTPLDVSNPADGYGYWNAEFGRTPGSDVASIELWTSSHPTTFLGLLGPGVVRLQELTQAKLLSAASQGKVKSASFDTGIPRAQWVSASALFKLQTAAANGLLKSVDLPVDALQAMPLNTRVTTERTTLLNSAGAPRDGFVIATFTAEDTLRLEYARPVTLHTQVITNNLYEVYEAQLLVRRAI